MKLKLLLAVVVVMLASATFALHAADMKLEAQLVWASNEAKSPNPRHRPVDAEVHKKLASLPLKWSHFFEEKRIAFDVTGDEVQRVELSDKCAVEVKHLRANKMEVTLFGDGKEVWKGVQPLPRNEILVLGGNAPGDSAWLVTLKRVE